MRERCSLCRGPRVAWRKPDRKLRCACGVNHDDGRPTLNLKGTILYCPLCDKLDTMGFRR